MNDATPIMPEASKCPQCGMPLKNPALGGLCPACLLQQGAVADTVTDAKQTPFNPPPVTELAALFPQLEILELIGKGGMGAVYKARQRQLDRIVALKILPPGIGDDPAFAERFTREAKALAKLNHPNIVTLFEFGVAAGVSPAVEPGVPPGGKSVGSKKSVEKPEIAGSSITHPGGRIPLSTSGGTPDATPLYFFLMEFVDGVNLRQLLQGNRISSREALAIVPQICDALQFAHDHGIVHRDIKPENILLDRRGRVKVADFGLAKIIEQGRADLPVSPNIEAAQQHGPTGVMGTPNYMAPEQVSHPADVDHRADIYALGVVFYQMLTGELPGKRLEPPSKKVQIDMRLDEVVLRALEKNPELRYQQVSEVKIQVETIADTSAPPPKANAEVLARELLARDYTLDIGSCLRRGWMLVRSDFWPLVGITALILALWSLAGSIGGSGVRSSSGANVSQTSSALAILVWGPLMGGLYLHFLKKIRGERTSVETAFSGFSNRFLHLFLGGFVAFILTGLGFLCLILPGIYLLVAWIFTLPLVIDKGLDFWPAMELSRKMVSKHWWKFLSFGIVLALLSFAGILACGIGLFVTVPIALAALMYAYEDIFGGTGRLANQPPAGIGPSGTVGLSGTPAQPLHSIGVNWTPVVISLAGVMLVGGLIASILIFRDTRSKQERRARWQNQLVAPQPAERVTNVVFGPVIERVIQARETGTNLFLDLDNGELLTPPAGIVEVLGKDDYHWQGLEIASETRPYKYVAWLKQSGVDLMLHGQEVLGFDGYFVVAHGTDPTDWENWDDITPEQTIYVGKYQVWSRRYNKNNQLKENPPEYVSGAPYTMRSAAQRDSREDGAPVVNLLTREQSVTYYFRTREGTSGLLQITGFTDNPRGVKIRYKLVQNGNSPTPLALARKATGFGSAVEWVLANSAAINLAAGQMKALPESITRQKSSPEKDTAACAWMERERMDFAYLGIDGFYCMVRDTVTLRRDSWEQYGPEFLAESLRDLGQNVAGRFGDSSPLNNPTNYTYGFKTSEGWFGLLQVTGFTDNPRGVKIRYKLAQQGGSRARTIRAEQTANEEIGQLRLQSAIREVEAAENRFSVGQITSYELQKVKLARDIATAEVKGDFAEVARLKLQICDLEMDVVGKMLAVGKATHQEYEKVKLARDEAAVNLREIQKTRSQ